MVNPIVSDLSRLTTFKYSKINARAYFVTKLTDGAENLAGEMVKLSGI